MSDLVVYRVVDSLLVRVGHIFRSVDSAVFRYDESYLQRDGAEVCGTITEAVGEAAESLCSILPTLPDTAGDLIDDMQPRLKVAHTAASTSR